MEMLLSLPWWVLLIASIVPYSIKQRRTQHLQSLILSALAWRFELQWRTGSCSWSFSLPWVEQFQQSQQLRKAFRSAWIQSVLTLAKKAISLRREGWKRGGKEQPFLLIHLDTKERECSLE